MNRASTDEMAFWIWARFLERLLNKVIE
jgi:hypothetical protein